MDAAMQNDGSLKQVQGLEEEKNGGDIQEEYLLKHTQTGIESMYTYSIVPGLGKQRGKRENTVNMRERESVGGVQETS